MEKGCAPSLVVACTATGEGLGSTVPSLLRVMGTGDVLHGGAVRAWCHVFVRAQQSCQALVTGLRFRMPLFYPKTRGLLNAAGQFVGYRQSLSATPRCNRMVLRAVFAVGWQRWDTVPCRWCIILPATLLTGLRSVPPPSLCNGITVWFFLL